VTPGKIILSCGCEYADDPMDIDQLLRTWTEETCTRDPDNPFVIAEISGVYCDECWRKMEVTHDPS